MILPEEKRRIEDLANRHKVTVSIIPRIGVSDSQSDGPAQIMAYQMMGREPNGNTCPFLDTKSANRAEHGGYMCKIYQERPLACAAYPLIETIPARLDAKCKFCTQNGNADGNLESEEKALIKIKKCMQTDSKSVWRYATGVGEKADKNIIKTGWFKEPL